MSTFDLDNFVGRVGCAMHDGAKLELRYGQILMDILLEEAPELHDKITGTSLDPYEIDYAYHPRVEKFFTYLSIQ